jgi:hypothetical protein
VQLKSIGDVGVIDALVRNDPVVDPVYPTSYDQGAYQRIQAVVLGIAIACIAFLAMLGVVAVTVTMNSVRAAIHSRRDEVTIMQLVGAPRWMVRGPFVVEGAITGAIAGAQRRPGHIRPDRRRHVRESGHLHAVRASITVTSECSPPRSSSPSVSALAQGLR